QRLATRGGRQYLDALGFERPLHDLAYTQAVVDHQNLGHDLSVPPRSAGGSRLPAGVGPPSFLVHLLRPAQEELLHAARDRPGTARERLALGPVEAETRFTLALRRGDHRGE